MFISSNLTLDIPLRIVSLVPSISELLHFLALEKETVGITKFCIHPNEWYKTKKRIGGTKNLNLKIIRELNPTLIIANKEENIKEQIELLAQEFPVFLTDVNNFDEGIKMIRDISQLTHTQQKANKLIKNINANRIVSFNLHKIKVAYLIWKDPYMVAAGNTFIDSMLSTAGLINVYSNKTRYPIVTIDELNNSDAEIILLSTEPYPFKKKHLTELSILFPSKKLFIADGEMFSWYGNRMLNALHYFKDFQKILSQ